MLLADQSDGATEDERIAGEVGVEMDGTVGSGNSHAVAVITHSGNHTPEQAARVQGSCGQILLRRIKRSEAEDIRIQNRTSPESGAQGIADHTADPGACASIGLQGTGVVVGLHLEGHPPLVIDGDDSGVVLENGPAPRLVQLAGDRKDRFLEHVAVNEITMADATGQGLVTTVL